MEPIARVTLTLDGPLDLGATLGALGMPPRDPTLVVRGNAVALSTRTPAGDAVASFAARDGAIRVEAWGDGAAHVAERAAALCGLRDQPHRFAPTDARLADLAHRFRYRRFSSGANPVEVAMRSVFGQRVTVEEARGSYFAFIRGYGHDAPGPLGLRMLPSPARVRAMTANDFERIGVDHQRARALRAIAVEAERIERDRDDADRVVARLSRLPGVGPWTIALVRMRCFGDASAALVGDWHVARDVVYALTGELHGDDRRMLELLAPYKGHEARVVEMIGAAGIRHPRRAPGRGRNPLTRPRV